MKKRLVALSLLLALLICCGCSGKNKSEAMTQASYAEAPAAPMAAPMADSTVVEEAAYDIALDEGGYNSGAGEAKQSAQAQEQTQSPEYGGRKIIRTLSLELRTDNFDEHLAQLKKDTQTAGGYVQNSYIYGTKPEVSGDSGRTASFTLRIPVEQADAFVRAASAYGTVLSQNEDTQDVTDSYFDIETRLEVNRATLERLKSILAKTESMEDIVALEKEISRVTLEIEDLTTNLRRYDGLIQFATVNITLYEEGMKIGPAAKTPFGKRVSEGFRETLSGVGNFLEDAAVLLLAGLPVLLPIALIVWLICFLRRRGIERDIANGMPEGLSGRERRWWKKDRRAAEKNAGGINPARQPEQKNDPEAERKNEE